MNTHIAWLPETRKGCRPIIVAFAVVLSVTNSLFAADLLTDGLSTISGRVDQTEFSTSDGLEENRNNVLELDFAVTLERGKGIPMIALSWVNQQHPVIFQRSEDLRNWKTVEVKVTVVDGFAITRVPITTRRSFFRILLSTASFEQSAMPQLGDHV